MTCQCENCNAKQRLSQLKGMVDEALGADHHEMAQMLGNVLYAIGFDFGDRSLKHVADGVTDRSAGLAEWLAEVRPEGRA